MIAEIRKRYNGTFSQANYEKYVRALNTATRFPMDFRVAETPLFLSEKLTQRLVDAAHEILGIIRTPAFSEQSNRAVPPALSVPNEDLHTTFLQIDFAICKDADGDFIPQLIELQGFPSLFGFQALIDTVAREHLYVPENFEVYFSGLTNHTYREAFKTLLLGQSAPESVVLLEIEPENQKTRIDFGCTEEMTGVKVLGLHEVRKRGRKLFYTQDGKDIPIERIYNRVIFDELERKGGKRLEYDFSLTDDIDAAWVGHPNWFFKISKFSLPLLKSRYASACYYLSDLAAYPDDLENYVLKPLFSFAGAGVEVEVTRASLDAKTDKENYVLQRKVDYAPLIETPDGYAKAEVRMMFFWDREPMLVNNLVRMSKGKMMGVAFNKDKTWVGSGIAYHPKM